MIVFLLDFSFDHTKKVFHVKTVPPWFRLPVTIRESVGKSPPTLTVSLGFYEMRLGSYGGQAHCRNSPPSWYTYTQRVRSLGLAPILYVKDSPVRCQR